MAFLATGSFRLLLRSAFGKGGRLTLRRTGQFVYLKAELGHCSLQFGQPPIGVGAPCFEPAGRGQASPQNDRLGQ